jgi:predicted nucleic acid-binding protein
VIVADTSVWVAGHRQPHGKTAETLRQLIDADEVVLALPVRLELMAGVARRDRTAYRRGLSALPVAVPTGDTWQAIERWIESAADAGQRFSVTDLLIGRLATEIGALVWSLDRDFERMESLGFVRCYSA